MTSRQECQDNVSWPLWWSTTGWWLQKNNHHQLWTQEAQHWHCCTAGDHTPFQTAASGNKTTHSFQQGKEPDEPRLHGMGFAVRNSLLSAVEPPSGGTACILSLHLLTSLGPVNFLSIYAPTLCSPAENKDEFYEELESSIREIPATEHLYLLGDFKPKGEPIIGHFSIGKLNENGQRLLELCSYHDHCITNMFFATKLSHIVSWQHPRSHHWHQLDLIITLRPLLNCILITHSYHSANCNTNHSLAGSKVCLHP